MRKLISLVLVTLLALSLFVPMASAEGEPVRLRFMSLAWIKNEQDTTKAVIDEWNAQNPGIQVELVQSDWGSIDTELLTGFETGDVPDIFHYWTAPIMTWKTRGFLADLSPMLTDIELGDVQEEVWDLYRTESGAITALPFQNESDIIFYNKTMFAEKGIEPPTMDNPWTFDQLVENAKLLSDPDSDVYGLCFHGGPVNVRYFNDTWATKIGESPLAKNEDGSYSVALSDRYIELAEKMKGLMYGDLPVHPPVDGSDPKENFLTGRVAILLGSGCWMRSQFIDESEGADVDWGIMPPIKMDSYDNWGAVQTLSIPEASQHKEEAMEFLKYFWNTENQVRICKSAYIFPCRQSAMQDERLNTEEGYWDMAQLTAQSLIVPTHVAVPGWGEFMNGIGSTIYEEYMQDSLNAEDFKKRVEEEGTRALTEAMK